MLYHSNYLLTKLTLKFNEIISRSTPKLPTVEQVRQGATLEATPQERGHFFAYAREVTGLLALPFLGLGFISQFFTSKGSFNVVFLGLMFIAATLYVVCLQCRNRQMACEATSSLPPVVFSTASLLRSILMGIALGIIIYFYLDLQRR